MYEIIFAPQFEDWLESLTQAEQDDVLADPTVARSFKDMKVGDLVDPPLHQWG